MWKNCGNISRMSPCQHWSHCQNTCHRKLVEKRLRTTVRLHIMGLSEDALCHIVTSSIQLCHIVSVSQSHCESEWEAVRILHICHMNRQYNVCHVCQTNYESVACQFIWQDCMQIACLYHPVPVHTVVPSCDQNITFASTRRAWFPFRLDWIRSIQIPVPPPRGHFYSSPYSLTII